MYSIYNQALELANLQALLSCTTQQHFACSKDKLQVILCIPWGSPVPVCCSLIMRCCPGTLVRNPTGRFLEAPATICPSAVDGDFDHLAKVAHQSPFHLLAWKSAIWGWVLRLYKYGASPSTFGACILRERASLNSGWSQICYVAEDDLEFQTFLPPPPQCSGDRHVAPAWFMWHLVHGGKHPAN